MSTAFVMYDYEARLKLEPVGLHRVLSTLFKWENVDGSYAPARVRSNGVTREHNHDI